MWWATNHIKNSIDDSEASQKPGFRTAKNFDSFRGEDGTRLKPCQFDDGRLASQPPEKLKAFLAVADEDSATYERWGFAKFEKGCKRQVGSNPYDEQYEKTLAKCGPVVQHHEFFRMIEPSWSTDCTPQDIEAYARSCLLYTSPSPRDS